MKSYIKERALLIGGFIVDTKETIRKAARVFNLSKSTVHNDVSKRLQKVDKQMYEQVKQILDENFSEKHIRGGQSTKRKFEEAKEKLL